MEKYHAKKLEGIGDLEKKQLITGWMISLKTNYQKSKNLE